MPDTRPTGITSTALIRAADIYKRYDKIITPLLQIAERNATSLSTTLNTFVGSVGAASIPAWNHLAASSYTELSSEISSIISNLKSLETQWHKRNDNANSAHGGIQEYDPNTGQYMDHQSRIKNPLHVIKNIRWNDTEYPADGRVNQSDFIGAYHFKSTIESLYAIATSLRDIYINLSDSSVETKVDFGDKTPYKDINLTLPNVSSTYIDRLTSHCRSK